MRSSSLTLMLPVFTLFMLLGCGEKKQESASNQTSPSLSQGTGVDTTRAVFSDSVDENGKPVPAIPIEEMTREQLTKYKQLLAENGFYSCCVEPTCRMCLFEAEECPCEHNLKKGEGVCGECYEGWQVGKGNVSGIKTKDVKKMD